LDDKQTFVDAIQAGYWDEKSRVLQIKFNWTEADLELEIK
jgi:oligosaccharide 4-alpha-D-glucosyltransferase